MDTSTKLLDDPAAVAADAAANAIAEGAGKVSTSTTGPKKLPIAFGFFLLVVGAGFGLLIGGPLAVKNHINFETTLMDTIVQQRSQLEEKQAIIAKLERLLPAEPVQHTVIRPVRRITETGYRFNFGSDSHVFRRQSTVEQCPSP